MTERCWADLPWFFGLRPSELMKVGMMLKVKGTVTGADDSVEDAAMTKEYGRGDRGACQSTNVTPIVPNQVGGHEPPLRVFLHHRPARRAWRGSPGLHRVRD